MLRDEAITHMVRALADALTTEFGTDPVGADFEGLRADMKVALDALLDFLDAHTEEWEEASIVVEETERRGVTRGRGYDGGEIEHNLVAALRGTTEEP